MLESVTCVNRWSYFAVFCLEPYRTIVTAEGKKLLNNLKKQGKEWREKFLQFRKLFSEILGEKTADIANLLLEIGETALCLPEEKKEKCIGLLDRCLIDLKKLNGG